MSDDLRELAVAAIAVPAAYVIWGRAVLARWIADPLGRNCAAAIAAYLKVVPPGTQALLPSLGGPAR